MPPKVIAKKPRNRKENKYPRRSHYKCPSCDLERLMFPVDIERHHRFQCLGNKKPEVLFCSDCLKLFADDGSFRCHLRSATHAKTRDRNLNGVDALCNPVTFLFLQPTSSAETIANNMQGLPIYHFGSVSQVIRDDRELYRFNQAVTSCVASRFTICAYFGQPEVTSEDITIRYGNDGAVSSAAAEDNPITATETECNESENNVGTSSETPMNHNESILLSLQQLCKDYARNQIVLGPNSENLKPLMVLLPNISIQECPLIMSVQTKLSPLQLYVPMQPIPDQGDQLIWISTVVELLKNQVKEKFVSQPQEGTKPEPIPSRAHQPTNIPLHASKASHQHQQQHSTTPRTQLPHPATHHTHSHSHPYSRHAKSYRTSNARQTGHVHDSRPSSSSSSSSSSSLSSLRPTPLPTQRAAATPTSTSHLHLPSSTSIPSSIPLSCTFTPTHSHTPATIHAPVTIKSEFPPSGATTSVLGASLHLSCRNEDADLQLWGAEADSDFSEICSSTSEEHYSDFANLPIMPDQEDFAYLLSEDHDRLPATITTHHHHLHHSHPQHYQHHYNLHSQQLSHSQPALDPMWIKKEPLGYPMQPYCNSFVPVEYDLTLAMISLGHDIILA